MQKVSYNLIIWQINICCTYEVSNLLIISEFNNIMDKYVLHFNESISF